MIYNPDLSAVESVDKKYWYVNLDDTVREMTQAEKDVVNADDLLDLKRSLVLSIDGEVERRIGEGFEYASKTFSLSGNAQIKWSGLYSARTSLDYPLVVCNIDDTDTYSIADAAEVATIYELIVDRVRTLLDQATTAKTNIMADTVVADAQAEHDAYIVSSY